MTNARKSTSDFAITAPAVTHLSLQDIHRYTDRTSGKGTNFSIYFPDDFPNLVIKEIKLKGLCKDAIETIRNKINIIIQLSHQSILNYYQVVEDNEFVYLVMERCDSTLGSLIAKHMKSNEPIPNSIFISILKQITDALNYLCNLRLTDSSGKLIHEFPHYDLKPANILINADEKLVFLADFGLSRDALRSGNIFAGTTAYLAPETLIYKEFSVSADIWSLGVIIYELITLKKLDFVKGQNPADIFVDGWKPELNDLQDFNIRNALESVFVLDPKKRPRAKELFRMLQRSKAPTNGLGHQIRPSITISNNNDLLIAALERDLQAKSAEIASQANEIKSLRGVVTSLKKTVDAKSLKIDALEQQFKNLEQQFIKTVESLTKQILATAPISRSAQMNITVTSNSHTHQKDASWTPLMCAVVSGDIKTAKKHLSEKNKQNNDGDTALTLAIKTGNSDMVELLDPTDKNGVTALMRAATRGDIEMVKFFIPFQKQRKDKHGNTAFMQALKHKQMDTATILRKHEALSWTQLMYAAFLGDIELAKMHLPEKEKKNNDGDTAYTLAVKAKHGPMLILLDPTDSDGVTALMRAADRGDVEAVRLLIPLQKGIKAEGGSKINGWWIAGGTALMRATAYGHIEVIKLLVECEGCLQDSDGWTALMGATRINKPECVKVLLKKEGGMTKNDGMTALILAVRNNNLECVKLLVEKEAGIQSNNSRTALMWAAYNNNPECAKLLIKKEKDIKTTREWGAFPSGVTAFDIAKRKDHKEVLAVFLKNSSQ